MPQLFPTYDLPEFLDDKSQYDTRYKRSCAWDPNKGDFVQDGAHKIIGASGKEAYMTWCYKTVMTERFKCLAYPDEIGVEMDEAVKEPDEKAVESAIERTITEALKVNPRTEYVRDFQFYWDSDTIHVSFVVKGVDSEEFKITT